MISCVNFFQLVFVSTLVSCFPVQQLNVSRSEIKHGELLPPDHIPGAHMEQDGDVNKEYHHEAFLGTLIKEGKLVFQNLEGYKELIKIFHKVDVNGDHRIDQQELKNWIHNRIMEHYNAAKNESDQVFYKVDHNIDGYVLWPEYKAQLLGLDPKKFEEDNTTILDDQTGDFSKELKHWLNADNDKNNKLDRQEFLAFRHPEQNRLTIKMMADEMLVQLDKNKDSKISLEEFIALPEGEVDEEDAELDREYQRERTEEFKNDMDMNSDGVVTEGELMTLLDPRHMQHAMKEADYLIRTSDRNRDGKISEHEMLMNYAIFTGSSFTNYAQVLHDEF